MKRQAVVSSNIKSIGYDLKKKLLEVEFLSGAVYQYRSVPLKVYKALISAPSVGSYFSANVRDKFQYERIR